MRLQIMHVGYSIDKKPQFEVVLMDDKRCGPIVTLVPPCDVWVANQNVNLRDGLRWYLEKYLDMPVGQYRQKASDVCKTLEQWGVDCFNQLFSGGHPQIWYQDARRSELKNLSLKIASDDPEILSWPWEELPD